MAEFLPQYALATIPRYTSYPPANRFHDGIGETDYRRWLGEVGGGDTLSLYVHVPFCQVRCGFCNLFATTSSDDDAPRRYLDAVARHAGAAAEALPDGRYARLAIGGGTPSYLAPAELERLFAVVRDTFGVDLDGPRDRIDGGHLALGPEGHVEGDLVAFLPRGRAIEGVVEGRVGGELRVEPHRHGRAGLDRYLEGRFWVWLAVRITGAFLVGFVLYALAPGLFRRDALAPARCLGLGLLVLVGAPVLLTLLGLTLVGLPLALLGAFAYVAALYAAGILVAARVGAALVEPETESRRAFGLALLVGLLVLAVGASLPLFGPVVRLLAALAGLGMLAQLLRERLVAARPLT